MSQNLGTKKVKAQSSCISTQDNAYVQTIKATQTTV